MALPELVKRRAEQLLYDFCQRRVPEAAKDKYRLEFRVRGNAVTLYESHAPWRPTQQQWGRMPTAQFRFDTTELTWTLYWADRNGRWHVYDEIEPSPDLVDLLHEVDADPTSIFFG
jgi:hypothetical protein